jgi:hypothetical protein
MGGARNFCLISPQLANRQIFCLIPLSQKCENFSSAPVRKSQIRFESANQDRVDETTHVGTFMANPTKI